ncbi:MAG TPA: hypothetical protein QGH16_10855 [Verrucomicrobiota bacterium]|nr:hypothetical protein [Verrucomicrobiota bacterium]
MSLKISQRQIVGSIEPSLGHSIVAPKFENRFAQVTGGEITSAVEKVYDGGIKFPETLCGPADIGDITMTRHYETERDGLPIKAVRGLVGQAYYNISISELNCDLQEPGRMRLYTDALLVGMTEPDGDASSGAPAAYSLTFSIGKVTE